MIRVLEVFREPMANGGQESFLMNMYRNMDREKVQMDFLTPFTCDNQRLKNEIESMGGQVFAFGHPFGKNNNSVFKKTVREFLKDHPYSIVHFHSGSTYALMEGSKLAAKAGIPNRIVHSHCGGFDNLKYRIIRLLSKGPLMRYPTAYFACSDLAAAWKFPDPVIDSHNYEVIKNAVDLRRFHFDPSWREFTRMDLGIDEKTFVVGHAGRFSLQKNHSFLIDVFARVHEKEPDSILLLAGQGELEEEIRQKVSDLHLEDAVRFLGVRRDMPDLMNAMDVFVLPSFFEGLPVVGVEAQATGLPVVTSDRVARELPIESLAEFLPLEDGPEAWADQILKYRNEQRRDTRSEMAKAGYEVRAAAAHLQKLYEQMAAQEKTR